MFMKLDYLLIIIALQMEIVGAVRMREAQFNHLDYNEGRLGREGIFKHSKHS